MPNRVTEPGRAQDRGERIQRLRTDVLKLVPDHDDRPFHGGPSRAEVTYAVRKVGWAAGREETQTALLELAAASLAWAERLTVHESVGKREPPWESHVRRGEVERHG